MGNNTTCGGGGGGGGGGDDDLFSEDVLIQILVCLPVISLLRFKSVCKSWRALIETPLFIDLHSTTTTTTTTTSKFGSFFFYVKGGENFVLSSRSSSSESSSAAAVCGGDGDEEYDVDSLGFMPYLYDCYDISISSCNGLICIHETEHEVVSLWNPATKQFRTLPQLITITIPPTESSSSSSEWYDDFAVLGFDVKTKDYKVVLFRCFIMSTSRLLGGSQQKKVEWFCRIQVYSLSTNSWRLLEGIHYLPAEPTYPVMYQNHGIYMNGCYFFVGRDRSQVLQGPDGGRKAVVVVVCNNSLIYSFDFTKEILTTIQPPDHDSRHDLILTNLGADKIALFMIQRNHFVCGGSEFHDCGLDYEYYHIWVLNDEQLGGGSVINKESWTKLHSFRKLNKLYYPTEPRGISNDGEFALISTRRTGGLSELELFNLVTGEATKDFPFGSGVRRSDVYRQSLVSLSHGNGAATTTTTTTAERVVGGAM